MMRTHPERDCEHGSDTDYRIERVSVLNLRSKPCCVCIDGPPRGDPIPLKKLQSARQHYSMMNVGSSRAGVSVDAVAIPSR